MKRLLLLSICSLCSYAVVHAQSNDSSVIGKRIWKVPELPVENDKIVYQEQVSAEGFKKDVLYTNAVNWLKINFKGDDIKMNVADKAAGHIAGVGKITYNQSVLMNGAAQGIYFDYDIKIKDNGYNYRISGLRSVLPGGAFNYSDMYEEELNPTQAQEHWTHKQRYEMLSDMNSFISLMISGLKSNITHK